MNGQRIVAKQDSEDRTKQKQTLTLFLAKLFFFPILLCNTFVDFYNAMGIDTFIHFNNALQLWTFVKQYVCWLSQSDLFIYFRKEVRSFTFA